MEAGSSEKVITGKFDADVRIDGKKKIRGSLMTDRAPIN